MSANAHVGQSLIPVLKSNGYFVTALVRKFVELGADELITNWLESKAAFQKMKEADAIVHLSGEVFARTWQEYYDANVKTTELVAQALREGNAQKGVFISYPGAAPDSDNLF